jgi:hypothetical protein
VHSRSNSCNNPYKYSILRSSKSTAPPLSGLRQMGFGSSRKCAPFPHSMRLRSGRSGDGVWTYMNSKWKPRGMLNEPARRAAAARARLWHRRWWRSKRRKRCDHVPRQWYCTVAPIRVCVRVRILLQLHDKLNGCTISHLSTSLAQKPMHPVIWHREVSPL